MFRIIEVKKQIDIDAAILAGGLGTRLRSVIKDKPKVLAQVKGKPFLAYLLDQLITAGIKNVVLCTGYKSEQVKAAFGDRYGTLRIKYSEETSPLGTAGALRNALPLFQSDVILVMNGDSFCNVDLAEFYRWYRKLGAKVSLLLRKVPDTQRFGRVSIDQEGRIVRFEEKKNLHGAGWINAGIYLIDRRKMLSIPPANAVSLETDVFPQWVTDGLYGFCSEGQFVDIGTPESYAEAEKLFTNEDYYDY